MNNLDLLAHSIINPEPASDQFYSKAESMLVISKEKKSINELQKCNRKVIESISGISALLACPDDNSGAVENLLNRISGILDSCPGMNYSELASYFAVNDTSFSVYTKLNSQEKKGFLRDIILGYIKDRHSIYMEYGYSDTALQSKADSFAHKKSGPQGSLKIESILKSHGIEYIQNLDYEKFLALNKAYIKPDSGDNELFKKLKVRKISNLDGRALMSERFQISA
jgi:hypothetical protein